MKNNMSRMLVEVAVKNALKSIKDDPERGIRNLVDMALHFSEGRFQHNFFATAQTMLQNENSAYYELIREVVLYTDLERLFTFGMNLGYNGCTIGARRIRENEKKWSFNIPWALILQMDTENFNKKKPIYDAAILEGENLGIFVWMIFAMEHPQKVLSLAKNHIDSAFCIFCRTEDLSAEFLDEISELYNVMLMVRYDENAHELYAALRKMGLLYSVWYPYGAKDADLINNGDLFNCAQQFSPFFTVLLPEPGCPDEVQSIAHQAVHQARNAQTYHTLLWELPSDNRIIDSIISDEPCSIYFDQKGDLHSLDGKIASEHHNLFQCSLLEILRNNCIKKAG